MQKVEKPKARALASFTNRDILDIDSLSRADIDIIMQVAAYYEQKLAAKERLHDMDGKIMASLFFEPSTRTRLSFESAMLRLGGEVITVAESPTHQTSSTAKGETLYDSIMVMDYYCDVIVCRSPIIGACAEAAAAADHPVINAGDGSGQHPTQALLDIYTIIQEKGQPDGLVYALVGDLKNGRTVHSLVAALMRYPIAKVILVSPAELSLPAEIIEEMRFHNIILEQSDDLNYAVAHADVIYMTRIQKERFTEPAEYERVKDMFILGPQHVQLFREGAIVMHPLPRVNEIEVSVDYYPGAAYFRQAGNGLPVRMALLALVSGCVC